MNDSYNLSKERNLSPAPGAGNHLKATGGPKSRKRRGGLSFGALQDIPRDARGDPLGRLLRRTGPAMMRHGMTGVALEGNMSLQIALPHPESSKGGIPHRMEGQS